MKPEELTHVMLATMAGMSSKNVISLLLDNAIVVGYPEPPDAEAKEQDELVNEVWTRFLDTVRKELGEDATPELPIRVYRAQVSFPTTQPAPVINALTLFVMPSAIRAVTFGQMSVTKDPKR